MKPSIEMMANQKGSVLVPALLMLALITIIVFAAMNTSTTEQLVSTNSVLYQRTLYGAEAGLNHAIQLMSDPFVQANAPRVIAGQPATWDFALNGSQPGLSAAFDGDGGDGHGDIEGGVEWINNATIGNVNYTVTIWNNQEDTVTTGGDFDTDTDGMIWIQSDAQDNRDSVASIRILLAGDATGEAITGYTAQAGAGAGKNYNANDLNPITDFSSQF